MAVNTPTKVDQPSDLFALTELAAGFFDAGGLVGTVDSKYSLHLHVDWAPTSAVAASPSATEWRLQVKTKDSLSRFDDLFGRFSTNLQSVSTTVSGNGAAASKLVSLASIASIDAGTRLFFKNPTFSLSEWNEVASRGSGTDINLLNPLENSQVGATVFTQGMQWSIPVALWAIRSGVRIIVNNHRNPIDARTERTVAFRATWQTLDNITVA